MIVLLQNSLPMPVVRIIILYLIIIEIFYETFLLSREIKVNIHLSTSNQKLQSVIVSVSLFSAIKPLMSQISRSINVGPNSKSTV